MGEPVFNRKGFARALRIALADQGVTMRDVAGEIGCSLATVSRVAGGAAPDVENYMRLRSWITRSKFGLSALQSIEKDDRNG